MACSGLGRLGCVVLGLLASSAYGVDSLGGDSVASDFDTFSANFFGITWKVEVSSFVYDSSSASVPAGAPDPGVGETLLAYLTNNVGDGLPSDIAVNDFSIGNPDALPIFSQGAATAVPTGLLAADRSDPRNFFVNPLSVQYNWQDLEFPPPATTVLKVGQWSVVYYLFEGTWTNVNGTVIGGGIPDNEGIPGPMIPEPASLLLFGVSLGLICFRRGR
jgi:hypothetical protein